MDFTISKFYCCKCGNCGIPIPRKNSKQREKNHKKKIYCLKCKEYTNHIEYRSFDVNFEEFKEILQKEMESYKKLS
ncbi:MAG: hypothetical protein HUJ68_01575 [Clostridia bacterium]|nr:hypothetical protein [Clostridia bacterium]